MKNFWNVVLAVVGTLAVVVCLCISIFAGALSYAAAEWEFHNEMQKHLVGTIALGCVLVLAFAYFAYSAAVGTFCFVRDGWK